MVLDSVATAPNPADRLPDDLLGSFRHYLDEWEQAANRAPQFRWEAQIEGETAEYLVHAFYRIVTRLAEEAERRGWSLMPEEADEFYTALVRAVVSGLGDEGPSAAEFAGHLRHFWPGVAVDDAPRLPGT